MSEKYILIGKPVSSHGYVPPGSVPRPCALCGQAVWVSPSSQALGEVLTWCVPCAAARWQRGTRIELVPGALAEAAAALQRN